MSAPPDAPPADGPPGILHRLLPDGVLRSLARSAGGAFVAYAAGAVLSFLLNVALARVLGPAGTGLFFLALTVVTVAALVGRMGLDNAVLRFAAARADSGDWSGVRGVERSGIGIALLASLAATAGVVVLGGWIARDVFGAPELVLPLRLLALAVAPLALSRLYGELLKAVARVRAAVAVQNVLVPLLTLPLLVLLGPELGVTGAVLAYLFASIVTAGAGWLGWSRATPGGREARPFPLRTLLDTSLPLFWVAGLDLLMRSVDVLALGAWRSPGEVGVYGVAARVSLVTSYVLLAVNAVVAPRFASLHARGEHRGLEELARKTTLLIGVLTLPVLLLLLVFPEWVLGLFGGEFRAGAGALAILVAGQLVNTVTGPVGYLLMMCGREKLMRNNVAVAATLNVVLNVLLVPRWGIVGAAAATASSLAAMNLISAVLVHRTMKIVSLPFLPPARSGG